MRPVITGLSLLLPPAAPASHDPCIGYDTAGFTGPDGEAGDGFGISLAVSGDIAVIGAAHDDDGGVDSGSAWVFRLTEAGWCPEQKLLPPDGADHDWFGLAVAVSGDRALVGAFGNDDNGPDSGSAYVFHYDGIRWSRQCRLVASDGAANDRFGYAVAMHGDVALVGAFGDDEGGSESGSAYVFRFDGAEWVEEAKLRPTHGEAGDRFGRSVAIWSDTALIGAPEDNGNGPDAGAVYVFRYDGACWVEEARLLASDGDDYDWFGFPVAIWGEVAVMGASRADADGYWFGSAYVFREIDGHWVEEAKLTASDASVENLFGRAVAIVGDKVVVGACWDDDQGRQAGSAYVFSFDGSTWIEQAKLLPSIGEAEDLFGQSVAIRGDAALIGAPGDDTSEAGAGKAYVFRGLSDCNANDGLDICDINDGASEDIDGDGVPDECQCPEDLNRDQTVNIDDVFVVLAAWGPCDDCDEDLNGDDSVDVGDGLAVLDAWGVCYPHVRPGDVTFHMPTLIDALGAPAEPAPDDVGFIGPFPTFITEDYEP